MSRRGRLPAGWVGPHWLESQVAADQRRSTAVGTLDGGVAARVDERGLVAPATGGWSLDWWIGAEDGWHTPSREPGSRVRQLLVGNAPVVETAMRVPGGEAVHRCYAVRDGAGDAVVVEVENRSHVPVALALAVRPYDLDVAATLRRIALRDDLVMIDRAPALSLGRPPAFAASSDAATDVAAEVFAGTQRPPSDVADGRDRSGLASLALVYPLPHTATRRIAIARAPIDPSTLPDADATVRGWDAHRARGLRVVVPDERLQDAVPACVTSTLLSADDRSFDDPVVIGALERWGFGDEVARLADRRGFRVPAGHGFVVDDTTSAAATAADVVARLDSLVAAGSPTWTWPGAARTAARRPAELLAFVRQLLVGEPDDRTLAVWPLVSDAWLGQGVEVHGAPTAHGPFSYAVRWHGARPAVLWEAPAGLTVTAPGLDPSWSSTDAEGEALLAPVEPAGGLPKVYGGGVDVVARLDEPGSSFR